MFLRVAAALALALFCSTASATLTPYTATYDATIVYVKTSFAEIGAVVAAQSNSWLNDQFSELGRDVDAAIVTGQLSYASYMDLIRAFYASAETKVPKFTETASARLENSSIDFAQYNEAAPASWCDFVFATFTDLADASRRRSLGELVATTRSAVEKQIEAKASAGAINDRMKTFYQQANAIDSSVIASFDAKVAAFFDATFVDKASSSDSAKSVQGTSVPAAPKTTSVAPRTNRATAVTALATLAVLLCVVG